MVKGWTEIQAPVFLTCCIRSDLVGRGFPITSSSSCMVLLLFQCLTSSQSPYNIMAWLTDLNSICTGRAAIKYLVMTKDDIQFFKAKRVGPGISRPACIVRSWVKSHTVMCASFPLNNDRRKLSGCPIQDSQHKILLGESRMRFPL